MGKLGHQTAAARTVAQKASADAPSASEFLRKWGPGGTADRLNERAGAQPHFIDLCNLLGVEAPADPDNYCFERGLWGVDDGRRFADVWKRGHFAWEYKAPGGDLRQALKQLMQYALPLENPPLLIVSDRRTIQIHTHFTGHPSVQFDISHADLRDPKKVSLLRAAFLSPRTFLPPKTVQQLTAELAGSIARIADALRARGEPPFKAAHFLTQCIFCFFAESVEVLPGQVFRRVVEKKQPPAHLQRGLTQLFKTMRTGGDFGADTIPWFNGGLFKVVDVPLLIESEIRTLASAASLSWASLDPTILGTLFERGLDPSKRNQMGAHYTDAATIGRLVDPVVRRPLLAEWDGIKRKISGLMSRRDVLTVRAKGVPSKTPPLKARYGALRSQASQAHKKAKGLLSGFVDRLQSFRVLDPACGSGNFLFLALKALKDIEHQVNHDAEELGLERQYAVTGPHNVLGIELNEYAAELARATVWIGELQWRKEHGYGWKENPILDPLDQIECRDAVLTPTGQEANWPKADAVVGNPPFVGDKRMRSELGGAYTEALRAAYKGRVSGGADLVCYWFDKARAQIEAGSLQRAGLVATNSIRGGANRAVLDAIVAQTRIFEAWSDEPWVNEGAAVRVSLVAFGDSLEQRLNDVSVAGIAADLSAIGSATAGDMTGADSLAENLGASFQGTSKVGPFDVSSEVARSWLQQPNAHGRSNAEVIRPWVNGQDLTRRASETWIVDFGVSTREADAALFEAPFRHVVDTVKAERLQNNRESYRRYWWRHAEARSGMRSALQRCSRFVATPRVSKFRVFVWQPAVTLPDTAVVVAARADDTTFGVLHSRFHELWSMRMCTWMGKGNDPRYTPTTCFETFPFPAGLTPADTAHLCTETLHGGASIPANLRPELRPQAETIARAAKRLVDLRDAWLNPSEWTERVPEVVPLGMDRSPYPDRIVAKPGFEKQVAKRTLTNLYNERPTWLTQAHATLDAAVAAAYGWTDYTPAMPDDEVLRRLLRDNLQRAQQQQQQRGSQRELPLLGQILRQGDGEAAAAGAVKSSKTAALRSRRRA